MPQPLNRIVANDVLSSRLMNDNLNSQELQATQQHGVGVLGGCVLSAGSGLNVAVSDGFVQSRRLIAISGFSQAAPDNATSYVFLDFTDSGTIDGMGNTIYTVALSFNALSTVPDGIIPLGRVTTLAGAITVVSVINRLELARQIAFQFTIGQLRLVVDDLAGRVGVGKIPTQGALDVQGDHYVSGQTVLGGQLVTPWKYVNLAGTYTILLTDPNDLYFKNTTGGDVKIIHPPDAGLTPGHSWNVHNDAASTHNLLIRDNADTTTRQTVHAAEVQPLIPVVAAGVATMPTSYTSLTEGTFDHH